MSTLSAPVAPTAGLAIEPMPFDVPGMTSTPVPTPSSTPRFAGEPVWWVRISAGTSATAALFGAGRVYDGLAPGLPDDPMAAATLIEITPLPRFNAGLLGRLVGGVPVQYVLISHDDLTQVAMPVDQAAVSAADVLVTPTLPAWVGFVRQDRICRDPRAWVDELDAAAQGAGAGVDASWTAYRNEIRTLVPATVRLTDHVGRPLTSGAFQISSGGGPPQSVTLTGASNGDTAVAVGNAGAQIDAALAAGQHSVLASTASDAGTVDAALPLTEVDRQASFLRLDQWLAPRAAGVNGLARWTTGNTVEPIVDGTPYFARLVPDLRLAKGGGAVGLAGWAFVKDGLQDPTKPWSLLPEDNSTELVALIDELVTGGAAVRILANQFLQITDADLAALADVAAVVLVLGVMLLMTLSAFNVIQLNPVEWVLIGLGPMVVDLLPSSALRALLTGIVELSKGTVDAINAQHPGVAVWTPYPASLVDNPLAENPLKVAGIPITALTNIGVYHQKIALMQPSGAAPIAYLGGIDINSDRIDDPTHRALTPFHDVQVRLTGPAVKAVVATFAERAETVGSTSTLPAPGAALPDTGRHVVQVGRTYFAPAAGAGHGTPFPSAPQGENTTHQTLLAAINTARDYIYIEDQYLTPDTEYVDALVAAAAPARGIKALLITVPVHADQPFGELRRGDVIHALAAAWGDRFRIGAPMRRYLNPSPQVFSGIGRLVLKKALNMSDEDVYLGPAERLPGVPFWAFIEGELVYVDGPFGPGGAGTGPVGDQDPDNPDPPDQTWWHLTVQRGPLGGAPRWGAKVVDHDKGACVLAVQLRGIYVHAKLMIVDDVFASVGSSNLNRRGLEHDGEINVFTVPESLKRDPDNPALRLRCRLWAEHLGLPPEMGLSLLSDPLSAIRYFDRSWYRGTHWQPLDFSSASDPPVIAFATPGGVMSLIKDLVVGTVTTVDMKPFWATLVDPTTSLDPHMDPQMDRGPHL